MKVDGDGLSPGPAAGDYRVLDFNPGMTMRWEIIRSTADTQGELLETTNLVGPGSAGPPVHAHPGAEESYHVLEGALEVFVNGEWKTLYAGDTVTVAAGTPHTVRHAGDHPTRLVNVHRPALRFEQMFRELHALIHTGKIKRLPPRDLRSVIYGAMLFVKYPDEQVNVKPPQVIFNILALIGRILGLKLEGPGPSPRMQVVEERRR